MKKPRQYFLEAMVLTLMTAGTCPAEAEPPSPRLSLDTAEQMALQANPETKETAARFQLAKAELSEERAKRLPTLKLLENYSFSNNPVFVFSSLLMQKRFTQNNFDVHKLNNPRPVNNFFTAAFVHVPIFTQLETSTAIARKKLEGEKALNQQELARQKIRFDLIRAYFSVLVAMADQEVADSAIESSRADVKQMQDMQQLGTVVRSDELAMEVQLSEFEQQKAQAEGSQVIALAQLNKALGETSVQPWAVQGQLSDREFTPPPIEQAVEQAMRARPDYIQSQLTLKQRNEEIRAAYGKYLPKVDAYGGVIQDGNALVNGGTSLAVAVNMTFDLFDLKKPAKVREAKAEHAVAQSILTGKANDVRLEVVTAYEHFKVAARKREVALKTVTQAQEALRIIRDRYKVGLTPITELLRAQTACVRAQTNLTSTRFEYYLSYADILRVTGQLTNISAFLS